MKIKLIAILCMLLIVLTPLTYAQEVDPEDLMEDILVYIEDYEPKVVQASSIEQGVTGLGSVKTGLGQGEYPVFALLRGMKTNPTISVPRIRNVDIRLNDKSNQYARQPTHVQPQGGYYTLDNLGYIVIPLIRIPTEKDVPDSIDIDMTARITYDLSRGFGVYEEDKFLPEISEDDFEKDPNAYAFWDGRGFIRLSELKEQEATFVLYDYQLKKIKQFKLSPQQTSNELPLSVGYYSDYRDLGLREGVRIQYDDIEAPREKAKLTLIIGDRLKIVEVGEGQPLYPGSEWYVNKIKKTTGEEEVRIKRQGFLDSELEIFGGGDKTLYKRPRIPVDCEGLSVTQCKIFPDVCTVVKDECKFRSGTIEKDTLTGEETTGEENVMMKQAEVEFNRVWKDHKALNDEDDSKKIIEFPNIIEGYMRIINNKDYKKQPQSAYIRAALDRLTKDIEGIQSPATFYTEKHNTTELDELMYKINSASITSDIYLTAIDVQKDKEAVEYFYDAINEYQRVFENYADIEDDNKKLLGMMALTKIADVSRFYLKDYQRAADAYKNLISVYYPGYISDDDKATYQNRIDFYTEKAKYSFNIEEIYDNGEFVQISLDSIEEPTVKPTATLKVTKGGSIITKEFELSKEVFEGTGWFVYEISVDKIILQRVYLDKNENRQEEKKTINLNKEITVDLGLTVELIDTNTKSFAHVLVLPGSDRAVSESEFSLHIPIEKRTWKLSPEQLEDHIKSTEKLINKLDSLIKNTEKVYRTFQVTCYSVFSVLFIKNLLQGGVHARARKEVIAIHEKICQEQIGFGKDEYYSAQNCIDENYGEIEQDIEKAEAAINRVDDRIEKGLGQEYEEYTELLKDEEYGGVVRESLIQAELASEFTGDKGEKFAELAFESDFNIQIESIERKVEAYVKTNPDATEYDIENYRSEVFRKGRYELLARYEKENAPKGIKEHYNSLSKTISSKEDEYALLTDINNPNPAGTSLAEKIGTPEGRIKSKIYYKLISYDKNLKQYFYNEIRTLGVPLYSDPGCTVRYSEEEIKDVKSSILSDPKKLIGKDIYFINSDKECETGEITDNEPSSSAEKHDPKITVFESGRDKGKLKSFSIDAYHYFEIERDTSGNIYKVYLWKREKSNQKLGGGTRITEFTKGQCSEAMKHLSNEEDSTGISKDTANNACKLLDDLDRCTKISTVYEEGQIVCKGYAFSTPIHQISGLQCYDIMDPTDCKILFGSCDPVMCPASRFNLGGRWNVDNVIQTGVAGSIFLGLPNFDIPYEPLPVCVTGVLAGLKNYKSIMEGYKKCLENEVSEGRSIGSCSYIRDIGICQTLWQTGTALWRISGVSILKGVSKAAGGDEYITDFEGNMENSRDFLDYFTREYGKSAFAAYSGGSIDEIGTEICKAAIFRKLPGQGSMIDQLMKPSVPPQFTAIVEEAPHSTVTGSPQSTYSIWYHVYAGEDRDNIRYIIFLRNSRGEIRHVTLHSMLLNQGDFHDKTETLVEDSGFNEVCIQIAGYQQYCGYGKVSSDFAINWANDKLIESEITKSNINSATECVPEEGVVSDDMGLIKTPLSILSSGLTQSGIIRKCSYFNPSIGEGGSAEDNWVVVGTCGKDREGRDLGSCWLNTQSANLIKNLESRENLNAELRQQLERYDVDPIKIKNKKLELDRDLIGNVTKYQGLINDLIEKGIKLTPTTGDATYDSSNPNPIDLENDIREEFIKLYREYQSLLSQTYDSKLLAEITLKSGDVLTEAAKLISQVESGATKAEAELNGKISSGEIKKAETESTTTNTENSGTTTPKSITPEETQTVSIPEELDISQLSSPCGIEYEENAWLLQKKNVIYGFDSKAKWIYKTDISDNWKILNNCEIFRLINGYKEVYIDICNGLKNKTFDEGINFLAKVAQSNDDDYFKIHTEEGKEVLITHEKISFDKINNACLGTQIEFECNIEYEAGGSYVNTINVFYRFKGTWEWKGDLEDQDWKILDKCGDFKGTSRVLFKEIYGEICDDLKGMDLDEGIDLLAKTARKEQDDRIIIHRTRGEPISIEGEYLTKESIYSACEKGELTYTLCSQLKDKYRESMINCHNFGNEIGKNCYYDQKGDESKCFECSEAKECSYFESDLAKCVEKECNEESNKGNGLDCIYIYSSSYLGGSCNNREDFQNYGIIYGDIKSGSGVELKDYVTVKAYVKGKEVAKMRSKSFYYLSFPITSEMIDGNGEIPIRIELENLPEDILSNYEKYQDVKLSKENRHKIEDNDIELIFGEFEKIEESCNEVSSNQWECKDLAKGDTVGFNHKRLGYIEFEIKEIKAKTNPIRFDSANINVFIDSTQRDCNSGWFSKNIELKSTGASICKDIPQLEVKFLDFDTVKATINFNVNIGY